MENDKPGIIHIVEPGMQELCAEAVESGKLKASNVPEESDVYLIVVPTPFKGNHEPDISYVETATRMVIPFLKKGDIFSLSNRPRQSGPPKRWQPALRIASGTGRENIHRLLPGARFARQCHLRADAKRPGDRWNQRRIDRKGDTILPAVLSKGHSTGQMPDCGDVQTDGKFVT